MVETMMGKMILVQTRDTLCGHWYTLDHGLRRDYRDVTIKLIDHVLADIADQGHG